MRRARLYARVLCPEGAISPAHHAPSNQKPGMAQRSSLASRFCPYYFCTRPPQRSQRSRNMRLVVLTCILQFLQKRITPSRRTVPTASCVPPRTASAQPASKNKSASSSFMYRPGLSIALNNLGTVSTFRGSCDGTHTSATNRPAPSSAAPIRNPNGRMASRGGRGEYPATGLATTSPGAVAVGRPHFGHAVAAAET